MCDKFDDIHILKWPSPTAKKCLRAGLKIEGIIRTKDARDVVEFWQKHAKEIVKTWPTTS